MTDWEMDMLNSMVRIAARGGFNFEDGYVSDFLLDIDTFKKLRTGERAYILVRKMGTTWCPNVNMVKQINTPDVIDCAVALISVRKGSWGEPELVELDPRDFVGEWTKPPVGETA